MEGVLDVLPGRLGRLCGHQGAPGSLACGCSFGSGRGLVIEVGGEGMWMRWRKSMGMRMRRKWWF